MKSHLSESLLPAKLDFHLPRNDGLFQPIRFVFVSERMRERIEHERRAVLDALAPDLRERQAKLFERYDPHARHCDYMSILGRFGRTAEQQ